MKVWLATRGEYSDYRVVAVCSRPELVPPGYDTECIEFHDETIPATVWREIRLEVDRDGVVSREDETTDDRYPWDFDRLVSVLPGHDGGVNIAVFGPVADTRRWKWYSDARAKAIAHAPEITAEVEAHGRSGCAVITERWFSLRRGSRDQWELEGEEA